jgi:hypothetical protein
VLAAKCWQLPFLAAACWPQLVGSSLFSSSSR